MALIFSENLSATVKKKKKTHHNWSDIKTGHHLRNDQTLKKPDPKQQQKPQPQHMYIIYCIFISIFIRDPLYSRIF